MMAGTIILQPMTVPRTKLEPRMQHRLTALLLSTVLAIASFASPASAQEKPGGGEPDKAKPKEKDGAGADKLSTTEHEIDAGGQKLRYRATAGTLAMKDEAGKHKADLFFVGYE